MSGTLVDRVLSASPIFDGHNDLPWALRQKFGNSVSAAGLAGDQPFLHTDIPRLKAGGVGAQFWSVFVPSNLSAGESVVATLEQIDCVHRIVAAHPDVFELVRTAAQVRDTIGRGKIASLIGMEGGHSIAGSLGVLRMMRDLGVQYMTLTHNDNTSWARSATGIEVAHGLTSFGKEVVIEMNRIGMIVDLSHVAEQTMVDALECTVSPIIFSHSSCRTVCAHVRNVPDAVLERLPANGGVLMATFVPAFVSEECREYQTRAEAKRLELGLAVGFHDIAPQEDLAAAQEFKGWESSHPPPSATINDVVRHLEHARDIVGPQHLGLGGDFDGIAELPQGMDGVAGYRPLLEALALRSWSEGDLRALTGGNILRVLEEVEEMAVRGPRKESGLDERFLLKH